VIISLRFSIRDDLELDDSYYASTGLAESPLWDCVVTGPVQGLVCAVIPRAFDVAGVFCVVGFIVRQYHSLLRSNGTS
jgi:hypothetical protein